MKKIIVGVGSAVLIVAVVGYITYRHSSVSLAGMVTIPNSASQPQAGAKDLGPVSADQTLSSVKLVTKSSPQQQADLKQAFLDMYNPSSTAYRESFTPQQFDGRFNISAENYNAILSWLKNNNFTTNSTASSSLSAISFGGTSKEVEDAFHITLHNYSLYGTTCIGTPDNLQVPANIAPYIQNLTFDNCVDSTSANSTSSLPITLLTSPQTPILIHNSGSTNSAGFDLTINSDGSGSMYTSASHTSQSSSVQLPAMTLDYQTLLQTIVALPSLQFQTSCAKSVSFGTTETVTYGGQTSGDVTCMPPAKSYQNFSTAINKVVTQTGCFNNDSSDCLAFKSVQTSGVDSGIKGEVSVSPIPDCTQPSKTSYNSCNIENYQASFVITKSDGTVITNVSTDQTGRFFAILSPGNYILKDVSAGSSTSPHQFYDSNSSVEYAKTAKDWSTSLSFTISPNTFAVIDPWFNGNSFTQ